MCVMGEKLVHHLQFKVSGPTKIRGRMANIKGIKIMETIKDIKPTIANTQILINMCI